MSQAWARVGNSAGFRVFKLLLYFALVFVVLSNLLETKYSLHIVLTCTYCTVFTSIFHKITFFLPLPIFVRFI
jgi:hypothetical protein